MHYIIELLIVSLICAEAKIQILLSDAPIRRIGTRIYKEELITDKFNDPRELSYDSSSRNLYFMYMDDDIHNSGRAYVNVISKQSRKIDGIERNKATCVDPETGDVYFGSEDGLYKYDPIENMANRIGLYNINILKIVIRNNAMYLIDANNHTIYKVFDDGEKVVKVGDMTTVMEFAVDNKKNIHYVSMCGTYCLVEGHEIVKNKHLNYVYHFLIDEEKTYGITENGIYDINCSNGTASQVANLDFFPRSFIFGDYGDMFYSIDSSIFRLRPVASYLVYNLYRNQRNDTKT